MNLQRVAKLSLTLGVLCTGCLERDATEPAEYSSYVLGPGVDVRPLERTEAAKMKLDLNDGLTGPTIPLRTGYVAGREVQYWELGQSPTSAEPIWVFQRRDGANSVKLQHPPLIDSIPGDMAYSPIRLIFDVYVTSRYANQQFPSLRALEDGIELGLLQTPVPREEFTNCAVTLRDITLEAGDGQPDHMPTAAFYRGRVVYQFCVDDLTPGLPPFPAKMGAPVFGNAYLLRRENQALSLDESLFKADLNGDDDMLDSNVVFDSDLGETGYSSLWKNLDVVVRTDYTFGEVRAQDAMFDKQPWGLAAKPRVVVEYKDTGLVLNRPLHGVQP